MKNTSALRETRFSVSRDYPVEITRARKTLWSDYKQARANNRNAKIAILYPAKLMLNGSIVKDLFPEWDAVTRGSRLDMNHPSQRSLLKHFETGFSGVAAQPNQSTPMGLPTVSSSRGGEADMEATFQDDATQPPNEAAAGSDQPQPNVIQISKVSEHSATGDTQAVFKAPQDISSAHQSRKVSLSETGKGAKSASNSRSRSNSRARSKSAQRSQPSDQARDDTTK